MEKNKIKTKKKLINHYFVSFLLMIIFISCSTYKYKITPEKKDSHRMIRLKVTYKDNKNKYSGKVIVLKKNDEKKIFILTPLGRVYFKLVLNKEKTIAVYVKKKKYWTGSFLEFIERIWGVDITFKEFYQIVISGKVPDNIKNNENMRITIWRDKNDFPKKIEISRGSVYLKLSVLKNMIRSGKIDFNISMSKIKKVSLEKLFEK